MAGTEGNGATILNTENTPDAKTTDAAPATITTPPADEAAGTNTNSNDSGQGATGGDKDGAAAGGHEDWDAMRTRLSNGDDKLLKRLSRYSTLDDYIKAGYEAQNKLSSIKANSKPGKDATPEEIAEYRKANGVPDDPTGYDIALPDGLILGDNDRPIAESFMQVAHKHNLPNDVVNDIIAQHLQLQEQSVSERIDEDNRQYEATMETLRSPEVWGGEFARNRNMILNLLNEAPPGVSDLVQGARLPDGSALANNPEVLVWLNNLARKINPTATLTDGNRSMAVSQIEDEMADIQKLMGDSNSEYWKGPKSEKMQARFRELTSVLQDAKR